MRKILLADKNELIIQKCKDLLGFYLDASFKVISVNQPRDFYRYLTTRPDFIIMDMAFLGLDVEETLETIADFEADAKVLFLMYQRIFTANYALARKQMILGALHKSDIDEVLPEFIGEINDFFRSVSTELASSQTNLLA